MESEGRASRHPDFSESTLRQREGTAVIRTFRRAGGWSLREGAPVILSFQNSFANYPKGQYHKMSLCLPLYYIKKDLKIFCKGEFYLFPGSLLTHILGAAGRAAYFSCSTVQ